MPFKEKAIVRHKLRPDWGAGRVLMRSDEYLQIDFTAGGLKKLKTSIADDHLEQATDEEVKALKPPKARAIKKTAVVVPPEPMVTAKAGLGPKGVAASKTAVAPTPVPAKAAALKTVAPKAGAPKAVAPKAVAPKPGAAKAAVTKAAPVKAVAAKGAGNGKSAVAAKAAAKKGAAKKPAPPAKKAKR